MTASTRRELRSAATSTSTTAIGLIRALTDARPIKPTSTRCLSARRPNPAEAPLIDAEILFRQPQPPQFAFFGLDILPVSNKVLLQWESAIYGAIMIGWWTTLYPCRKTCISKE